MNILKNNFQFKISKTLLSIILSILSIVSISIIVLSTFLYKSFYQQTHDILGSTIQEHLAQNNLHLAIIKEQIYTLGINITNDLDVKTYLDSDKNDPVDNYLLIEKLQKFTLSNNMIDSVYIYSEKRNDIISNLGLLSITPYDTTVSEFLESQKNEAIFPLTARTIHSETASSPLRNVFSLAFSTTENYESGNRSPQVILNIKEDYLLAQLSSTSLVSASDTLVFDSSGSIINKNNELFSEKQLWDTLEQSSKTSNYFVRTFDKNDYLITYIKTDFWSWTLVNIAPIQQMSAPIQSIRNTIFGVCITLLFVSAIIIVLVSHRIYKPFDEIIQKIFNITEASDTIYDSAKIISNSMSQLMQQNDEYKRSLEHSIFLAQRKFLNTLVNNHRDKSLKLEDCFAALQIPFIQEHLHCLFICLYPARISPDQKDEHVNLANNKIMTFFEDKRIPFLYIEYSDNALKYIIKNSYVNDEKNNICSILTILQEEISEMYDDASFVLSKEVTSLEEIYVPYYECCELEPYLFMLEKRTLLNAYNFNVTERASSCNIDKTKDKFLHSIKANNESELIESIDSLFAMLDKCTYDLAKLLINQLALDFINCSNTILGEFDNTLSFQNIYNNINHLPHLTDVKEFFLLTGHAVITKINDKKSNRTNLLVRDIKQYILTHYSDDMLCSETFAQLFHLTPGYIGKLFSEQTKTTLTEYITEVRLSKAAELLVTTTTLVSDVSSLCGFSNRTYFASQFKKKFGMSPKIYRETYRETK